LLALCPFRLRLLTLRPARLRLLALRPVIMRLLALCLARVRLLALRPACRAAGPAHCAAVHAGRCAVRSLAAI
jgi:hypothetical protein